MFHIPLANTLFCSGSHNTSVQNELKQVDLNGSIAMILEVMPEWFCFVFIDF